MPITYVYNPDDNVVYTNATGVVGADELREYFEKILADATISNRFWEIVNIEKVTNVTLTYKDCTALSSLVKRFINEKEYQGTLLFSPKKLPSLAASLFFAVLRTFSTATFLVSSKKKEFEALVFKHVKIKYQL